MTLRRTGPPHRNLRLAVDLATQTIAHSFPTPHGLCRQAFPSAEAVRGFRPSLPCTAWEALRGRGPTHCPTIPQRRIGRGSSYKNAAPAGTMLCEFVSTPISTEQTGSAHRPPRSCSEMETSGIPFKTAHHTTTKDRPPLQLNKRYSSSPSPHATSNPNHVVGGGAHHVERYGCQASC